MFVGSVVMTFESLMRLSRGKAKAYPHRRPLLCGLLAGPSLLWLEAADRESFALFLGIRALEVLCNYGTDAGLLPTVPHADTLLMMASSIPTLWAWLLHPELHDSSYKKFLDLQGGRTQPRVKMFGLVNRLPYPANMATHPHLAELNTERANQGYAPIDGLAFPALTHKAFMHPEGVLLSYARFLQAGMQRALPVYLPVYGVSTLVFRGPSLLKDPVGTARAFAQNVVQSSVFLTTYCAMSWVGADVGEAMGGKGQVKFLLAGSFGGSAVLLERKSRRAELALYVFSHAVKVVYRAVVARRWMLPMPSPLGETACFSMALAVILHAYCKRPELMRKTYFGTRTRTHIDNTPRIEPLPHTHAHASLTHRLV
jgi:hypothetical protein